MPILEVTGLQKSFLRGAMAVNNLDLTIDEGEIVSLLGPSGCGKTTSLRCIAGLERPDGGEIRIAGRTVFGRSSRGAAWIPPEKRGVAMVFQQYALWPHMDVFRNVAFGLQTRRLPKAEVSTAVERALKSVQLWHLRDRRISQLSGGQQQRIALARAIALSPQLILFDEPLSNLDAKLREGMRQEIVELQQKVGFAALYVTHDQDEAFSLSSRIVVMNSGHVEQIGTPSTVWTRPASEFVADFVGSTNKLPATVINSTVSETLVRTDAGPELRLSTGDAGAAPGDRVTIYLRTGSLKLSSAQPADATPSWRVPVLAQAFHGTHTTVRVGFGDGTLTCVRTNVSPTADEQLWLSVEGAPLVFARANES